MRRRIHFLIQSTRHVNSLSICGRCSLAALQLVTEPSFLVLDQLSPIPTPHPTPTGTSPPASHPRLPPRTREARTEKSGHRPTELAFSPIIFSTPKTKLPKHPSIHPSPASSSREETFPDKCFGLRTSPRGTAPRRRTVDRAVGR